MISFISFSLSSPVGYLLGTRLELVFNPNGLNSPQSATQNLNPPEDRHSRMVFAGIQGCSDWTLDKNIRGVTTLDRFYFLIYRSLLRGSSFDIKRFDQQYRVRIGGVPYG